MVNIYDTINELERNVRDLEAYNDLNQAMDAVLKNEEARQIYIEFRNYQLALQSKMMVGQEPSEDDMKKAQEMQESLGKNELLSDLMKKEQALNKYVEDVNQAIMRPIREIYNKANQKMDVKED
ncbi:hypothetical protein CYJ27_04030 [Aerococcus christensenii]|uniref:UPF0342 protein CYJ27_04030 n=1 Tax=Aerococcus christensenii TaxID=87541 RepID=A0A2I1K889_9LACT|nr:YlbF family regulator [Aerococcus christensenii]PKY91846.1 hypothetical protein CYJ27_04030 [Aerococcus christensenii]